MDVGGVDVAAVRRQHLDHLGRTGAVGGRGVAQRGPPAGVGVVGVGAVLEQRPDDRGVAAGGGGGEGRLALVVLGVDAAPGGDPQQLDDPLQPPCSRSQRQRGPTEPVGRRGVGVTPEEEADGDRRPRRRSSSS